MHTGYCIVLCEVREVAGRDRHWWTTDAGTPIEFTQVHRRPKVFLTREEAERALALDTLTR